MIDVRPVSGGDISTARLIRTGKGRYFLKVNEGEFAQAMTESEAKGLKLLQQTDTIRIPKVHLCSTSGNAAFLLMEYINPGQASPAFWESFGTKLARLHRQSREAFGLDHNNFIGKLPQRNASHSNWVDFFIHERMLPQIEMAVQASLMDVQAVQSFDPLFKSLDSIFPPEPPALIHGDLWSGNFLVDEQQRPVLIDPSVSYAHREMDLAMSRLFGGFSPLFYQAYHSGYPTAPGLEERLEVYQLYYLMVHVNLFGGAYLSSVKHILRRFT